MAPVEETDRSKGRQRKRPHAGDQADNVDESVQHDASTTLDDVVDALIEASAADAAARKRRVEACRILGSLVGTVPLGIIVLVAWEGTPVREISDLVWAIFVASLALAGLLLFIGFRPGAGGAD